MSKILYGVAGEGSGHSSRAKVIIPYLLKQGHSIKVISYDRGYKNLSPYFDAKKIFGLHFHYENNEVKYAKTILKNLKKISIAVKSVKRVLKIIDDFKPDLVFSDFEPISCITANLKKLPLISLDNQHRITNTKIEYPSKYKKEAKAAQVVINMIIFNAKAYLVTSFFKTKIIKPKTYLLPPLLKLEILNKKMCNKDYILVYLTSEFKGMIKILKNIDKKFIVYGFNRNQKAKNIIFKKPSQAEFLKDLASCQGIIANAGFTLITEALYLRKPYLALPLKGQFEQILNAYHLEKLGYGKYWDDLNKEKIEDFLANLSVYRKNLKKYKREDNSRIFKKIDELIKKYT